jgi:hypothetical protein
VKYRKISLLGSSVIKDEESSTFEMGEIRPSIAGLHTTVRTYPEDYAASDTESEHDPHFENETEDEETISVPARLLQNQQYMHQQITSHKGEPSAWVLEPQNWKADDDSDVILIRKPTASNLSHRVLNPHIYRNIQNLGTLDDLAILLETQLDWEERYNQVVDDGYIVDKMNNFRNLQDNTPESDIQFEFSGLVEAIATSLRVRIRPKSETKIIVGGILARYQYDLRSKTDPNFIGMTNGINLIASEAKTHLTFAPGEMWYNVCLILGIINPEEFSFYLLFMHSTAPHSCLPRSNGNYLWKILKEML